MIERLYRDERGFTSLGMAIALLLTLALLFSAAQVYRVQSKAAEIQEVADACALAAESTVGEFMVAVRLCDSVVLTLSLTGAVAYGLGVVGLCVPAAQEIGMKLTELGKKVFDARDAFSDRTCEALNALQGSLPFLAAAQSAATAQANGGGDTVYRAVAVLVPSEGRIIDAAAREESEALASQVDERKAEIAEEARAAEEAALAAQEAKERAFRSDCGDAPDYCMYERASKLAAMDGARNPLIRSIDAWSFSVPLDRARAYYRARLATEAPGYNSTEERARSVLRKRFYRYAVDQLKDAYVRDGEEGFSAHFPRFPRNTDQVRATELYGESVYPVTVSPAGAPVMHAWSGCPKAAGASGSGSIAMLDEGGYETCSECRFTRSSMGSVAAASTSIRNGFEHHYDRVAQAAEDYEQARRRADPSIAAVKADAEGLFDQLGLALDEAVSKRIKASPPGRSGCVALVVASGGASAAGGLSGAFVRGDRTLGARAAVAGATLVEDGADESSVIGDLLSGLDQDSPAVGAASLVLRCWSGLLRAYGEGQEALTSTVEETLDGLPLLGAAGLGSWASAALKEGVSAAGLEPADDKPLKPVLVDTGAVTVAGEDAFSVNYGRVKDRALSIPGTSADFFAALVNEVESEALAKLENGQFEIACIELPVGDGRIPLVITLPPALREGAKGLVEEAAGAVRSIHGSVSALRPWE